jgi:hypothetical protein
MVKNAVTGTLIATAGSNYTSGQYLHATLTLQLTAGEYIQCGAYPFGTTWTPSNTASDSYAELINTTLPTGGGQLLSGVGLFSARPASGTNVGDMYKSTDSPINSIWSGSTWLNFISGWAVTLPGTFSTTSNVNTGTQSNSTGPLIITNGGTANQMSSWTDTLATTAAIFRWSGGVTGSGPCFRESSTNKIVVFNWDRTNSRVSVANWTNNTTFGSLITSFATNTHDMINSMSGPFSVWRLRTDGGSIFLDISFDGGISFFQKFSETKTSHFTTAPNLQGICSPDSNGEKIVLYSYEKN